MAHPLSHVTALLGLADPLRAGLTIDTGYPTVSAVLRVSHWIDAQGMVCIAAKELVILARQYRRRACGIERTCAVSRLLERRSAATERY
jgi:hypothetical protein